MLNKIQLQDLGFRYIESKDQYAVGTYTKAFPMTVSQVIELRRLLQVEPLTEIKFCKYVTIECTTNQPSNFFSEAVNVIKHDYPDYVSGNVVFQGKIDNKEELLVLFKQLGIDE